MRSVFGFPNPVNEVSARLTAAGVLIMSLLTLTLRLPWMLPLLACGFVARAISGPRLSPLGLLVTRVVVPRLPLEPRMVAGPPKQFAQMLGAGVTLAATTLHFGFGRTRWAYRLTGLLALFAFLESALGLCVGCKIFGGLMKLGLIPETVCTDCADIWARYGKRL